MRTCFSAFFKTFLALGTLAVLVNATMVLGPASQSLAQRLEHHVRQVALVERNTSKTEVLDQAANYIEGALAEMGYQVKRREYTYGGQRVRNLEVGVINTVGLKPPERIFIVGAHYDSARGGASDNGSGTAAVIELARVLKGIRLDQGTELKFVFFVNAKPPYFMGKGMDSWQHARDNTGNFIAFVGTLESSELVRKTLAAFRASSTFPAEGLAAPAYVEGITFSDHSSYKRSGYPALMITDTEFLRYPYYHTEQDAHEKPDYTSMAQVVDGIAKVIEGIAAPIRM